DVDVVGRVDLAHAALAQLLDDAIAAVEDLAHHRRFRRRGGRSAGRMLGHGREDYNRTLPRSHATPATRCPCEYSRSLANAEALLGRAVVAVEEAGLTGRTRRKIGRSTRPGRRRRRRRLAELAPAADALGDVAGGAHV